MYVRFLPCIAIASLAGVLFAAPAPSPPADDLYAGWLKMYDLKFPEAQQQFKAWEAAHPSDPMGPLSQAAGYLFAEFARLGVLESEMFTEDKTFLSRRKLNPDSAAKQEFSREISRADNLANTALAANGDDERALLVKSLSLGLQADYAAMIEKQNLLPLRLTKESRVYAEKLLHAHPTNYDAYLGPGVENYLLSLKPAPIRFFLEMTGSKADRQAGVEALKLTAAHGHYLEPYAKLLLAVAAIRDKDDGAARGILAELHNRFPENPLYLQELQKLGRTALLSGR